MSIILSAIEYWHIVSHRQILRRCAREYWRHLVYVANTDVPVTNRAPVASVAADDYATVQQPQSLQGQANDDGLPDGSTVQSQLRVFATCTHMTKPDYAGQSTD